MVLQKPPKNAREKRRTNQQTNKQTNKKRRVQGKKTYHVLSQLYPKTKTKQNKKQGT